MPCTYRAWSVGVKLAAIMTVDLGNASPLLIVAPLFPLYKSTSNLQISAFECGSSTPRGIPAFSQQSSKIISRVIFE